MLTSITANRHSMPNSSNSIDQFALNSHLTCLQFWKWDVGLLYEHRRRSDERCIARRLETEQLKQKSCSTNNPMVITRVFLAMNFDCANAKKHSAKFHHSNSKSAGEETCISFAQAYFQLRYCLYSRRICSEIQNENRKLYSLGCSI